MKNKIVQFWLLLFDVYIFVICISVFQFLFVGLSEGSKLLSLQQKSSNVSGEQCCFFCFLQTQVAIVLILALSRKNYENVLHLWWTAARHGLFEASTWKLQTKELKCRFVHFILQMCWPRECQMMSSLHWCIDVQWKLINKFIKDQFRWLTKYPLTYYYLQWMFIIWFHITCFFTQMTKSPSERMSLPRLQLFNFTSQRFQTFLVCLRQDCVKPSRKKWKVSEFLEASSSCGFGGVSGISSAFKPAKLAPRSHQGKNSKNRTGIQRSITSTICEYTANRLQTSALSWWQVRQSKRNPIS